MEHTSTVLFTNHLNNQLPLWFSQTGHMLAAASNTLYEPRQAYNPTPSSPPPPSPILLLKKRLVKIRED